MEESRRHANEQKRGQSQRYKPEATIELCEDEFKGSEMLNKIEEIQKVQNEERFLMIQSCRKNDIVNKESFKI